MSVSVGNLIRVYDGYTGEPISDKSHLEVNKLSLDKYIVDPKIKRLETVKEETVDSLCRQFGKAKMPKSLLSRDDKTEDEKILEFLKGLL